MKERGMIFTAESVRAMLREKDPKTQTRRPCKQAYNECGEPAQAVCQCRADGTWFAWWSALPIQDWQAETDGMYPNGGGFRSPLAVGDVIWARETFYDYVPETSPDEHVVGYRADAPAGYTGPCLNNECGVVTPIRWKSAIHMPRWASRLSLQVTDVRAQRVQSITEEDARAEGCEAEPECVHTWWEGYLKDEKPNEFGARGMVSCGNGNDPPPAFLDEPRKNGYRTPTVSATETYAALWDSIHGPGAWERNDWVWAYTFERILP